MTSKDRFPNHETICGQCGTTIYKPFKELSDDEIADIYKEVFKWDVKASDKNWVGLARALIKKASEK